MKTVYILECFEIVRTLMYRKQLLSSLPLLALIMLFIMPGDHDGEVIPVPIPNTEVKLSSADDTADQVGK